MILSDETGACCYSTSREQIINIQVLLGVRFTVTCENRYFLKNSIVLLSNKLGALVQKKNINEPMLTFSPFSAFGPFSP